MAVEEPEDTPTGDGRAAEVARLVAEVTNADIEWAGTLVGLAPTVVGEPARLLLAAGDAAMGPLVDALGEEDKFVAAHVVLTTLADVEYLTVPWNGLDVELAPAGPPRIDPAQRHALISRWRSWLRATPHPRSLPPV